MLRTFSIARPRQLSEVLKYEHHPDYCREVGTVSSGQVLDLGQVVAIVTATNELVSLDPTKTDGSEKPVGFLLDAVDATGGDVEGVPYTARGSMASASGLRWPAGITAAQQATALGQLAALGIIVRDY